MLRRFLITFCIIVSIVIIFSAIITQKREERRSLEAKQKELAKKVDYLSKKNSELKKEYDALINDPVQIEKEARENYGYIRPGEVTYKKLRFTISEPKNIKIKPSNNASRLESFLFEGSFPWQIPLGLISIASVFLLISYKYERKGLHRKNCK